MKLSPERILAQVNDSLSAPLPESDLAELLPRIAMLEEQVALLRDSSLLSEEPSLPPSLEEQP